LKDLLDYIIGWSPKRICKIVTQNTIICLIIQDAQTYQQKAQLTSLASSILDLKILLKASALDRF
jgi:hypothetical protein